MRDSFVFYKSFYDAIKQIPEEYQLELYNAILQYSLEGTEPSNLSNIASAMFTLIKPNIDNAQKKYEASVSNGKKGGRPKKEKPNENLNETQEKPNENLNVYVNDNDNDNVNVNGNVNDKYIASEVETSPATAKASKHKYGKFKNVLLKDEELQRLKEEYNNWEELIEHLSYYIEMKGYKAKSHYLAIRKWVVNAVAEDNARKAKTSGNPFFEMLQEEGKL